MSSFPQHVKNIKDLEDLGLDVSEYLDEDGQVDMDSWDQDELVDLVSVIVKNLQRNAENK
jgi:hypothetical protein